MVKKMMMNCVILMIGSILFAGIASAHVVVYPTQTTQGSYEKFTVRVPSEEEGTSTVKVEVRFQVDAVSILRFEPKPGWTYEVAKDAENKITGVTWTSEGDGLARIEFGEFSMQGKVADAATQIEWKAYQTYKNGTVVEWTGAEGSQKPSSITLVQAKAAGTSVDSHGQSTTVDEKNSEGDGSSSQTALYLSIAAVVLGALALIVSIARKKA
ncbi:YcnI family copper-binding membrane protein [Paenibacillus eucommiae]|uniref:Uncharacterized protein YcnI n=1 Tax=Paenibacillus eucommiae TaxID=1355755 RepID=A0ABS4J2L7_9BACL|nr:YcnI family protein [Paenibacillus eucommiae]MBP1993550.1 uncharacterized protein YcnI [Paenibacillus eucommiae]